jgi:hypothetical protein
MGGTHNGNARNGNASGMSNGNMGGTHNGNTRNGNR